MIRDDSGSQTSLEGSAEESLLLQIQALGQLPSPSHTALRLFSLLQSPDSGLKEIAAVVKSDPTLTVRLLRLANRPGNGSVRPAVAVEEALVRLGLNAAVHLAAGLSVLDNALTNHDGEVAAYIILCRRSLAAAVVSEWLCGQPGVPAGSAEMFTCALLARVGQLALLRFYPDAYSGFLGNGVRPEELLHLERQHFGVDHVAINTALLHDWGFPGVLVDVIRMAEVGQDDLGTQDRKAIMAQILRASWDIAPHLVDQSCDEVLLPHMRDILVLLGVSQSQEGLQKAATQVRHCWQLWSEDRGLGGTPEENPGAVATGQPGVLGMALFLAPDRPHPEWVTALEGAGYRMQVAPSFEAAARQLSTGQADLLLAAHDAAQREAHAPLLEALVGSHGHAVILLQDQPDEVEQARLLALGIDAVLPCSAGTELVTAQVGRAAQHVRMQMTLEAERASHRRILSQLAVTTRKLHRQTLTDPLTGLANRRMADAFLKRHWAQAERRQTPLGCLLIDLDDFKQINDAHGHDAGDRVLVELAGILKRQVRQEDLAVRLGGDEFLMICPLAREADLEVLCKRLLAAAARLNLETGPLSFSTGIAERDPHVMKTPEDLLRAADQKLMRVKRGR
ncbi:MAG: diguanylate cyclase [Betaproteobacteria bacterium]|nr:diguanylate cyclase [Betaproteobacteria bacterium]